MGAGASKLGSVGGMPEGTHSEHSRLYPFIFPGVSVCVMSPDELTYLMPVLVQRILEPCALSIGAAIATPSVAT